MKNEVCNNNIFIATERLYIKKLDRDDYVTFHQQQKDPFLMKYFGGPREDEGIKKIFDLLITHQEKYGFSTGLVFLKQTKEVIGRAGLVHLDFKPVEDIEIGYFIAKPYCGSGYATELGEALIKYAFDILHVSRIYATIDPKNTASCRVSEKLHLTFEKQDTYDTLRKVVNFYTKTKAQYQREHI
jgi:ribosomal-protein-alanine N-acetyltransferase